MCSSEPQGVLTFLSILFCLLASIHKAASQAVSNDDIVFTTMAGWEDMVGCAQNAGNNVVASIGCKTNKCFCQPSHLGQALLLYADKVLSDCSNYDDQRTATEFLASYCSEKGYTSIESAVLASTSAPDLASIPALQTTGALPTVTKTVTTVIIASATSAATLSRCGRTFPGTSSSSPFGIDAAYIATLGLIVWLMIGHRLTACVLCRIK